MNLKALSLIFLISPVYADNCQSIYDRAYDLQLDRQKGIYREWTPKNRLESDMKNNIWQRPQYRSIEWKIREAEKFAGEWYRACKNNLY